MDDSWINVDWVLGHLVEGENAYRDREGFDNPKGQGSRSQLNGCIEQADTNRDKDQQEKFPDIPVQTQFIRSLNEGDGTYKGGSDSLGLDSFTNELKEGIDWHDDKYYGQRDGMELHLLVYIDFEETVFYETYDFIPVGTLFTLLNEDTMLVEFWGKTLLARRVA